MNPIKNINRLKKKLENRGLLDMDYLQKLSPEDAAYLAEFLDKHYGGKGTRRRKRQNDFYALSYRTEIPAESSTTATPEDVVILKEELYEEK